MNPQNQIPKQIPFCCDCTHFIPAVETGEQSPPRCKHAPMIDVVLGKKFFAECQDFRHPQAPCGQIGKFFEPKEPLDAPQPLADN